MVLVSFFVCFICLFGCYIVSFVVVHIYRTLLTICSSHISACSIFYSVIVLCAYTSSDMCSIVRSIYLEDEYKVVCAVSNNADFDDLE